MDALTRLYEELSGALTLPVKRDELLARHTSFRIGGPAALFAYVDSIDELQTALDFATAFEIPYYFLGRGTNMLISDEGFPGLILALGPGLRRIEIDASRARVRAAGGALLARAVSDAAKASLAGLEFACGIPGTVGAAIIGNVGTADVWMGECVQSVTLFVPGVGLRAVAGEDVRWNYRNSSLRGQGIVVAVELQLRPGDRGQISNKIAGLMARRRGKQPHALPNAGSVFKNPTLSEVSDDGEQLPSAGALVLAHAVGSAGQLIESAGCKGMSCGGAQVSDLHANFIVNTGGATAGDVTQLIREIQERVEAEHGIRLEPEISFLI